MLDSSNPFAAPSSLPYQFPRFDRIRLEHYRPAFDAGIEQQLDEVRAIADSTEPPTFDNTIEAMERSGRLLERVLGTFFNVAHSMATEEMQQLEAELAPRYSTHRDTIQLDPGLFARVDALHDRAGELVLTPEQTRVLDRYHTDFVRAGAALPEAEQSRLRQLNEKLTQLSTEFGKRTLAERNDVAVHLTDRSQLDGLDDDRVEAARRAASERGLDGYLLTLVSPTIQPEMASLKDRGVRRRLHEAATSRGMRGGEHDSRALISQITALRAERAGLLGFDHHAAYIVADQTAGSTAAVLGMLEQMTGPAMANLDAERAAIEKSMSDDGADGPVEPWDWAFYAARAKADSYRLDLAAMRPYFELDRVLRDGVFYAANRLYGITFAERHDLPLYHKDVRAFDVHDHDGSPLGLFVCDWFARPIKSGGAWMNSFVEQSRLHDTKPAVVVCLNVPKPADGKPALMTAEEVTTAFHEFGHALHGLFSDADYPRLAGTNVPRDFVEFPSQVNEMWAWHPDVIAHYARHHQTGEALDQEVAQRFAASRDAGRGFDTVAMLGAALLDQEWHLLSPDAEPVPAEEVAAFEQAALDRRNIGSELVPPRYRSGYFSHAFTTGYDAGYYAYLWSEVLDADMVDWFAENGGLRRENGDRFRTELLSRGGTVDAVQAFAAVRGRPPSTEPLMRRRGLLGD